MNKRTSEYQAVPSANIAVNKSRVKLYNTSGEMPTYYLQKGQEFQIELFNPTQNTILAKITLNDRIISQGGLILKPGQRVFLERFLDVEKKFLFDTYEVANTSEVKEAIKHNGDFKVEFFNESRQYPIVTLNTNTGNLWRSSNGSGTLSIGNNYTNINSTNSGFSVPTSFTTSTYTSGINLASFNSSSVTMDSFNVESQPLASASPKPELKSRGILRKTKSIETGRVEEGSQSDQKFKTVVKDFEYFPFHTIECKMLPISQKVNTTEDINVKKYCTNCGAKLGKTDKFCSNCGAKA